MEIEEKELEMLRLKAKAFEQIYSIQQYNLTLQELQKNYQVTLTQIAEKQKENA